MNKRALRWSLTTQCTEADCSSPYTDKTGNFIIAGQEWVAYRLITQPIPPGYQDMESYDFTGETRRLNWSHGDVVQGPNQLRIGTDGWYQGLTYRPDCATVFHDGKIRVACLARFISDQSVTQEGKGMMSRYVYPFTEEWRFFVSDIIPISSLIDKVHL